MHRKLLTALLVFLASCGGGGSSSLVVIGDSITLRTGLCSATDTLPECARPELSYATYLPNVAANLGRGGDTCTTQESYTDGPFSGQARGLLKRLDEAIALRPTQISVLIGVNDLNSWGVSQQETITCITQVWDKIKQAGIKPVAVTYGAMPLLAGWKELNASIRIEAAKRGIRVVDFEAIAVFTTIDGIHPDAATARKEADLWLQPESRGV